MDEPTVVGDERIGALSAGGLVPPAFVFCVDDREAGPALFTQVLGRPW